MTKVKNIIETYHGFEIDHIFRIYKDGKQVFTAHWQMCKNIEQAKRSIDNSLLVKNEITNYQERQLNKYGNVLPEPVILPDGTCELENGIEEMNRFAEWNNEMAERQLMQYEHQ